MLNYLRHGKLVINKDLAEEGKSEREGQAVGALQPQERSPPPSPAPSRADARLRPSLPAGGCSSLTPCPSGRAALARGPLLSGVLADTAWGPRPSRGPRDRPPWVCSPPGQPGCRLCVLPMSADTGHAPVPGMEPGVLRAQGSALFCLLSCANSLLHSGPSCSCDHMSASFSAASI